MSDLLTIQAGKKAYQHIQENGLSPDDISAVFGASGAAKWLAISGLDIAIFSEWFTQSSQVIEQTPVHLFGTSVGAWKLAAAAQQNPQQALNGFANAYIEQFYGDSGTHADVQRETDIIIKKFLDGDAIESILSNNLFRFHCGAVRCKGFIASDNTFSVLAGLTASVAKNFINSDFLASQYQRIIFSDPRLTPPVKADNLFQNQCIPLSAENFTAALSASGSIPYVMKGVDYAFEGKGNEKENNAEQKSNLKQNQPCIAMAGYSITTLFPVAFGKIMV